jgi:hypothetical protein
MRYASGSSVGSLNDSSAVGMSAGNSANSQEAEANRSTGLTTERLDAMPAAREEVPRAWLAGEATARSSGASPGARRSTRRCREQVRGPPAQRSTLSNDCFGTITVSAVRVEPKREDHTIYVRSLCAADVGHGAEPN